MPDVWLIVEATFPNLQGRDIIRRFVKPIVDEFDGRFVTFHFFFERQFLLRMKAEERLHTESIMPFIERKLTELNATNRNVRLDRGYTEEHDYADGWVLAQRIFENGSRASILIAEAQAGNATAGPQFNEGKFVHLVLNQCGYTIEREASFHFDRLVERLEMLYSGFNLDTVNRKHHSICEEVWNSFGQPIKQLVGARITES
jgi:hypothetical protein